MFGETWSNKTDTEASCLRMEWRIEENPQVHVKVDMLGNRLVPVSPEWIYVGNGEKKRNCSGLLPPLCICADSPAEVAGHVVSLRVLLKDVKH